MNNNVYYASVYYASAVGCNTVYTGSTCIWLTLLKLGKLHPVFYLRMHHYISLINTSCPLNRLVSKLHVDIGMPRLLIRFPFHPALKNLPCTCNITEHLFHVCVFVPVKKPHCACCCVLTSIMLYMKTCSKLWLSNGKLQVLIIIILLLLQ